MKSGRELKAENIIVKEAPWPHHSVWKGATQKGPAYNTMSVTDFTCSYLEQIEAQTDPSVQIQMMSHLKGLLDDHKDLDDWDSIRTFHATVLTRMERGLIDWNDTYAIDKLRQKFVYAAKESSRGLFLCLDFNKGTCTHTSDHAHMKHVCAFCLNTTGKQLPHGQHNCFKLNGPPKTATT